MPVNRAYGPLLSVIFCVLSAGAQTPVSFLQPESIGSCTFAVGADFNGDGNMDVACPGYDSITIWLGNGNGQFHQVSQTLPYPEAMLAAGVFTASGHQDLVVAVDRGATYLLPGNGDGTFGSQIPIPGAPNLEALTAADVNQDGKLDLVVSTGAKAELLLGNGDGTFQKPQVLPITASESNIVVADFNGDGIPDIAIMANISNAGTLQVLLGQGNGAFGSPIDTPLGTDWSNFVVADFNADGILDVAWNYDSNYVLLGNGDGTFSPGPVTPCPLVSGSGILLAADLNGDGLPDLVLAGMGIALNQDGGKFGEVEWYQNSGRWSAIAADFRNLGRLDLMVGGDFYPNDGTGHFNDPRSYTGCFGCEYLELGDFNNDGNLDVAGISDVIQVYPGEGNGDFKPIVASRFKVTERAGVYSVATGDFNNDGNLDIALSYGRYSTDGETDILFGNGDGTFSNQTPALTGHSAYAIAVADFNRGGNLDMALGLDDEVRVIVGNGAGSFQTSAILHGISETKSVVTADFNLDGIPDLATASDVFLGNGDGTFRHAYTLPQPGTTVQTGDVNGDGIPDLVTSDGITVVAWPGIGDGTFGVPVTVAVIAPNDTLPTPFVVADWNGDGISDVAVIPSLGTTATFYLGRQDGSFAEDLVPNLWLFSEISPVAGVFTSSGLNDLMYVDNLGPMQVLVNTSK